MPDAETWAQYCLDVGAAEELASLAAMAEVRRELEQAT